MHRFAVMNLPEIGPSTRKNGKFMEEFFFRRCWKSIIFGCRQGTREAEAAIT